MSRPWLGFYLILVAMVGVARAEPELADPTRPASGFLPAKPDAAQLPTLNSMLVAPDRRSAVVNGTVVRLGSTWSGLEVLAIAPGRLTVRREDEVIDLKMLSKVKKTPHRVGP